MSHTSRYRISVLKLLSHTWDFSVLIPICDYLCDSKKKTDDMADGKEITRCGKTPLLDYWNKGGFALCTEGYADVVINEQNFRLTRGRIFIVTPLVQIYSIAPSADFRTISFVNDLKVFYPIFKLIADTGIPLKVREYPSWRLSEEEISHIVHQDNRIFQKQRRLAEDIPADERALLLHQIHLIRHETMLEVVGNHIRNYPAQVNGINKQEIIAYRFILSLHGNYHSKRSVSWYASEANLSSGHFTTLIKAATGKTPSEWIATVTTTYAKLLLEQRNKSIKQIAAELNFPEQFTFRKYFKLHTGVSPKEYRNSHALEQKEGD